MVEAADPVVGLQHLLLCLGDHHSFLDVLLLVLWQTSELEAGTRSGICFVSALLTPNNISVSSNMACEQWCHAGAVWNLILCMRKHPASSRKHHPSRTWGYESREEHFGLRLLTAEMFVLHTWWFCQSWDQKEDLKCIGGKAEWP